jgi:hypothetical protein
VRSPLPSRSAVKMAVIAVKLLAGRRNTLLTAEIRYLAKATHFGWSARSAIHPPRTRTSALTPW